MKQGYIYIYILCTSIKSNLQPRDHRISSTTQPDARALNILLAIIRFTNKRKSLKPRRALAGIEFSFHEREEGIVWRGGRDEQPLEDSFEFSFTGDHSRDQTGSFTDRSPLLPQAVLPFHLVLSVIRPSSLRWNSHCLPPCLSLSYRFRGRPTDSYFSENSFNVLTGSIFEYRNVFVFHNIIVVPPWINASFIILTMDRDTMERYFSSYTITIIYFHQCG